MHRVRTEFDVFPIASYVSIRLVRMGQLRLGSVQISIYLFIVYIFSQGSQRFSRLEMVFNMCFFINLTRLGVYCLGLYQKVFAGTTPMIELEMLRKLLLKLPLSTVDLTQI